MKPAKPAAPASVFSLGGIPPAGQLIPLRRALPVCPRGGFSLFTGQAVENALQ